MGSINGSLDLMGRHRILENTLYKNEAEGNPVSFKTNVTKNLKECIVELSPKQDFNGYDHPWVGGTGKNLWNEEWELGVWDATGTKVNNDNAIRSKGYIPVNSETTYYLYLGTRYTVGLIIRVLDSNKSFVSTITLSQSGAFTIPEGGVFIVFCTYASNNITTYNNDIAINYPSTVTTYSPYSNICPIDSWGGKNLLPTGYNAGYTYTTNGITFTVNSDGSVTANGTATSQAQMRLQVPESLSGNYYYSGAPSGFSQYTIDMYAWNSTQGRRLYQWDGTTICDADEGQGLVPIQIPAGDNCGINIRVYAGKTINNVTFYPMICKATTTDPTWQPYRKIENVITHTGKNLAQLTNNIGATHTIQGVKWIANADGTITASRTASGSNNSDYTACNMILPSGTYISSFGQTGSGSTFQVNTRIGGTSNWRTTPFTFTLTEPTEVVIVIRVYSAYSPSDLIFYPMIHLATETDSSYASPTQKQYTVTWENDIGEVFGGSLNLTTGEMVSEWKECVFDGLQYALQGPLDSAYANTHVFYDTVVGNLIEQNTAIETTKAICNMLPSITRTEAGSTGNKIGIFQYHVTGSNQFRLAFPNTEDYATVERIYAIAPKVVIPLATPITYHLTPVQIKTLLETNVLTTDGDNIRVTYWKH